MAKLRTGDAFWIVDFPPLDGREPKTRTAIYLDMTNARPPHPKGHLMLVGTTTDMANEIDPERDHDAVYIATGLPQECWAIPRWARELHPSALGEYAGRITMAQSTDLLNAVVDRAIEEEIEFGAEPEDSD